MLRIDTHQHFWKYNPIDHGWIPDEMAGIRRDFLPPDLITVLKENDVGGSIAIQADQTLKETAFLIGLSEDYDFIKGVVGWVDLQAPVIEEQIQQFCGHAKFKGVRHILQAETQRDLMLQKPFLNGISQLRKYDLTYDILIYPDQLQFIPTFTAMFPDTRFVIDHIAKPDIKNGQIDDWKRELARLTKHENVYCKLSGLVTEADLKEWKPSDFTPYLDAVVEVFGINRIMYGSDWPVCLAAGSYNQVLAVFKSYFGAFTENEQQRFFGKNAGDFYRIPGIML